MRDSPALLLIVTGALLGLTFPLGKLAIDAMISPVVWAWLISAGSGIVLLFTQLLSGQKPAFHKSQLTYFALLAFGSLVLPNILIFSVIPKLGSGFAGILHTLSPIFTLALSLLFKFRVPTWLGVVGIAVGLAGAVIVTLTRGEVNQPAGIGWILAGLCIPISLAVGNMYRTLAWPDGAQPIDLAIGCNLVAAFQLFLIIVMFSQTSNMLDLLSIKKLVLVQIVVSTAMFSVFFRLQQIGGPTYLSQIGYISAGVALVAGTVFLGERYSPVTWFGAAVIVVGIGFSVVAQRKQDV